MFTKQCTRCKKSSFSSNNLFQWLCPYCANDLTETKAMVVNHSVNVPLIEKNINQQKGLEIYRQLHNSLNQKV